MRGAYELQPEPQGPDLPDDFVLCDHAEGAIDTIAADLFLHAQNCVRAFGDFHLAIDGGRFAERLCQTLLLDPMFRGLPWKRTHLWVVADAAGDEPASQLLRELVAHHADLPSAQFHPIDPAKPGEADRYQSALREHLGWRERGHDRLDFVFMSGDDRGSLTMVSGADSEPGRLVARFDPAGAPAVAMTPTLINAARFTTIMAMGPACRAHVSSALLASKDSGPVKPLSPDSSVSRSSPRRAAAAGRLSPIGGMMRWYIDEASLPGDRR